MQLSEERKQKLRKYIEHKIASNKDNMVTRIKIDPMILEQLLFYHLQKEDGSTIKFPIWTGDFLSHIDLRQVSYDHVVWNLTVLENYGIHTNQDSSINMSGTNAHISFSKAQKHKGKKFLYKCNFAGTNLQNNLLSQEMIHSCCDCNFCNTKIGISFNFEKGRIDDFVSDLKNGIYEGCFINGILIGSNLEGFKQKYQDVMEQYQQIIDTAIAFKR